MSLRELYQEMIVDHGRHPRNFGELASANHEQVGNNPLCGDKLKVFVLEEAGIIKKIMFIGSGCAISMASASLMSEIAKEKSKEDFFNLFDAFHKLVTESKPDAMLGKLEIFGGVAEFPARVKCATLAWHTLKAALDNEKDPVSTE